MNKRVAITGTILLVGIFVIYEIARSYSLDRFHSTSACIHETKEILKFTLVPDQPIGIEFSGEGEEALKYMINLNKEDPKCADPAVRFHDLKLQVWYSPRLLSDGEKRVTSRRGFLLQFSAEPMFPWEERDSGLMFISDATGIQEEPWDIRQTKR